MTEVPKAPLPKPNVTTFPDQAIGNTARFRFICDPENLQTRNATRVLRRLPLRVSKVSRHCNYDVLDFLRSENSSEDWTL